MIGNGYQAMQRETLSGRALEREVFSRITARMEAADPSVPGGLSRRTQAVVDNHKLWSTLAADLANPKNTCPPPLRASLLSLALFIEKQTATVLRGEGSPDVLIDINRNIIKGLGAAEAEAA